LFSGGLDSLSGAIEELATTTKGIALVSHRSSTKIFDHQKRLISTLKARFPRRLIYLPIRMTRQQDSLPAVEHTHRSRSFLYASLACVVARLFGNDQVRFFENGGLSINLPIAEQVVGARATRTTHPLALRRFREFFTAAMGKPIEIENPFIWNIKADVVRSIIDHGCGDLIKDTVSCSCTRAISKEHTHCGCCSQCIDRRFGVLAAHAADHDPVEKYKVELLAGERDRGEDKTMAESYVRTALELRDISESAFFGRFSGLTSRVCDGFPSMTADDISGKILHLHHRHAQAIEDVLGAAVKRYSVELIRGDLPASSLLRMIVARDGPLALASIEKRIDAQQTWLEREEAVTAGHRVNEIERDVTACATPGAKLLGFGAKTRGILEAFEHLWPNEIPKGLSAKDRNKAVLEWLSCNSYSVPINPERAIQRVLKLMLTRQGDKATS
jgi:hypothetical protein